MYNMYNMYDIAVYGGSFAGCAAALKAAKSAPDKNIILINPEPAGNKLGGIGTIGGQNYFDTRKWRNDFPQKGSFERWHSLMGDYYNVDAMSDLLIDDLNMCPNISILFGYDIEFIGFYREQGKTYIDYLVLRKICRDNQGFVKFEPPCTQYRVGAEIFIDGSNDGKLVRLTDPSYTTGRYDWPCPYLDCSELLNKEMARQQVTTLMFKVTGIQNPGQGDMNFTADKYGSQSCWGGNATYRTNQIIKDFNNKYGPLGYAIKPVNAAQNGAWSKEWWVNTFLVFNIDGRAQERDRGSWRYPKIMRRDYKNVDEGWAEAREFLRTNSAEFLNALHQYSGFANVDFVYSSDGYPVVGEVLYLRETIHLAKDFRAIRNETENSNYNLTPEECIGAGDSCNNGADAVNYGSRIGLCFYWSDINGYKFEDLKDSNGEFVPSVVHNVRSDLQDRPETAVNPVYVPYSSLTSKYVANLMTAGYAVGCSSLAWAEIRVIPNLCVLGDAAGVASAYAVNNNKLPLYFSDIDIFKIQSLLVKEAGARLDKYKAE